MSASVFVPRVGVWRIGARGSVATTVAAGGAALTAGLHPPTGLVTETPPFTDSGGHDTVDSPLPRRAEVQAVGGVLTHDLTTAVNAELAVVEREIRPGGRREPKTGLVDAGRSGEQR